MSDNNAALQNQLAHLVARTNHARSLPMLIRTSMIDELLTLQLALLGTIVDRMARQELRGDVTIASLNEMFNRFHRMEARADSAKGEKGDS